MAEREPTHEIQTELSRDLGLTSALAIGVGTMIAAGIFTLSGLAVGRVGSSAIVAFLLAAVVALVHEVETARAGCPGWSADALWRRLTT